MNKKHLLVAASALVVGLGFTGQAFAGEKDYKPQTYSTALNLAVAASVQAGEVEDGLASGTVGENKIGTISATGLINANQNNGANSLLQSQNTLGAVLGASSCGCTADNTFTGNGALALSAQVASVEGGTSYGAATVKKSDSDKGGSFSVSGGGHSESSSSTGEDKWTHTEKGGGFDASGAWHNNTYSFSSTPVGSSNSVGTLGGIGMINVSQNNGNNSMIQSGNTAAAITFGSTTPVINP